MERFDLQNYCMAFVDLLGQRDALKGEGLLPVFADSKDEERFRERVKGSIGQIVRLQEHAAEYLKDRPELSMRNQLDEEDLESYDEARRLNVQQLRWSDGLVLYTTMRGRTPMNAIFNIFGTAGGLCLLGLGMGDPIRGGIDVSWGAELHDGEIYGAVVANSYELETLAQYPRIIVGNRVIQYLNVAIDRCDESDKAQLINRALAKICLQMIGTDVDGHYILNYLGGGFTEAITKDNSKDMYEAAYKYAHAQYEKYQAERNSKLAVRYNWLLAYMEAHRELHT